MAAATPVTLPLDPSIYNLNQPELSFFKTQTGIQDDAELKRHILDVQAEAYAVHPYPCIRRFGFTTLKISRHPAYQAVLKLGIERSDTILLDLGCCVGNDARKAVADGFPRDNVIASDICPEFWTLGHKLFKTTQETYPLRFIPGDIFDPSFFSPDTSPALTMSPGHPPSLATLTSLTPLKHHVTVIHTSSFFHLFSESEQSTLAHLLGTLLSPLPGSMIFGSHMGVPDTKENEAGGTRITGRGSARFGHSPSSWEKVWVGKHGVFRPENVVLSTNAMAIERKDIAQAGGDPAYKAYLLVWSITRV